ncbi:hypothetical protein IW261DRAFT_1624017 [Armillaria novae-zelandiae]|uniref:Uncharacterized protein n=1 Tax=Armillaria novae-zelandiae TaxID=153914 RepID=A0AA39TMG0_9AGAR|nr:hypothetical protein IW261DRAFT_1624017 [Armillaria novae-zelandiae]
MKTEKAEGFMRLRALLFYSSTATSRAGFYEHATPYSFVSVSQGFHFDNFEGDITAGIPVTLSWHRNVDDPSQVDFEIRNTTGPFPFNAPSFSLTNTQLSGTLDVTFLESGQNVIEAIINQTTFPATTQTFDVTPPSERSVNASLSPIPETGWLTSSSSQLVQSTITAPPSFTESVQSIATDPPNLNSTHRSHRASTIIGAVIGSLMSLLLLFAGGIFLFRRRRRHRNFWHRLPVSPKIVSERNSYSPPVGNKNTEAISPMLAGEMTPDIGTGSQEPVEESPERDGTKVDGERRSSIATSVHNTISEDPSLREEDPQAPLDDVGVEVLRLRDEVLRLVERVHTNAFDPPPAYV